MSWSFRCGHFPTPRFWGNLKDDIQLHLKIHLVATMLLPRNQVQGLPTGTDKDSYTVKILATCWTVEVLSAIFVALRIYCKRKGSRRLWYDDYILIAALVSFQHPQSTKNKRNENEPFNKPRPSKPSTSRSSPSTSPSARANTSTTSHEQSSPPSDSQETSQAPCQ